MYFVSVTRLHLKSIKHLFAFMGANGVAVRSLRQTPGFIQGVELMDGLRTFWTLTVWDNEQAMRMFRNGDAHRKAMQSLPGWCDEASYANWQQPNNTLPDWDMAYKNMIAEGRVTKVRYPSERHLANEYPPPKLKLFKNILRPAILKK